MSDLERTTRSSLVAHVESSDMISCLCVWLYLSPLRSDKHWK